VANNVMSAYASSNLANSLSSVWNLASVTARDNGGGTTNQAVSTATPVPGGDSGDTYPPGTAVCISWSTSITARGGRSRSYLPGVPRTAANNPGDSLLASTYAVTLKSRSQSLLTTFNGLSVSGVHTNTLGTLTHYAHHSILTTPIWRPFLGTHVHERIDSQRRRNGKEISFPIL
jgi:hypothetical protein